jgi:hypothetical protein
MIPAQSRLGETQALALLGDLVTPLLGHDRPTAASALGTAHDGWCVDLGRYL